MILENEGLGLTPLQLITQQKELDLYVHRSWVSLTMAQDQRFAIKAYMRACSLRSRSILVIC